MQEILVIDDDESVRELLATILQESGFRVTVAADGQAGLELLRQQKFDLFLVDLVMPGIGGLDVVKGAKALSVAAPAIVITAHGTIQTAVEAMRLGVYDYITKPFNLTDLQMTITRALDLVRLQRENASLRRRLSDKYSFKRLIGTSPRMQRVFRFIEKVADTDTTILITGESGTGKELVAKTLHYNSSRGDAPFVPINCAAIPKDLIESEFFGHEKGAFTGAVNARIGRFEMANGGTLFLDEIGDVPAALQAKLLRVIQEKEFERVGGTRTIRVDVRILAATNRNLEKMVADGTFREDLFYRLNVIPLRIPPLRERKDDIPLLIDHFVKEICRKKRRGPVRISPAVRDRLVAYRWPGNVRELENALERMIILCENGVVEEGDLPDYIAGAEAAVAGSGPPPDAAFPWQPIPWKPTGIDLNGLLDEMEKTLILEALRKSGGVKNKAAALLGLNRTTLLERMKKKGIGAAPGAPGPEQRAQ